MFCLSKNNKLRIFFIKVIENIWFERIISLNIILCAIFLFFYTYAHLICEQFINSLEKENCLIKNQSGINRDLILNKLFIGFNIIFTIEMICKFIAMGLILHKNAYLRSFWNIVDVFATVYSLMEIIFPNLGKTVILRIIRLLRILKNIKTLESIRKPINCIMLAVPTIANVLLFLGFIFTVFATLGIQLFSGSFYKRCRNEPVRYLDNITNSYLYKADPITDFLCTTESIYGRCPKESHCVNFYEIPTYFNLTEKNITIEDFNIENEKITTNPNLIYGIPNFDTIINCFVNVFVIITYQNWTDIYSLIIDSNSNFMVKLYFNIIVIFGGFFIMKMIFAAQNEVFIKVKEDEQECKLIMLRNFSLANTNAVNANDLENILQNIHTMEIMDLFKNIEHITKENKKNLSKKKSKIDFLNNDKSLNSEKEKENTDFLDIHARNKINKNNNSLNKEPKDSSYNFGEKIREKNSKFSDEEIYNKSGNKIDENKMIEEDEYNIYNNYNSNDEEHTRNYLKKSINDNYQIETNIMCGIEKISIDQLKSKNLNLEKNNFNKDIIKKNICGKKNFFEDPNKISNTNFISKKNLMEYFNVEEVNEKEKINDFCLTYEKNFIKNKEYEKKISRDDIISCNKKNFPKDYYEKSKEDVFQKEKNFNYEANNKLKIFLEDFTNVNSINDGINLKNNHKEDREITSINCNNNSLYEDESPQCYLFKKKGKHLII